MRDPVAALRAEGCDVRVIAGYASRSAGTLAPLGLMLHHTASSVRGGDSAALGICINGRSDLPGPLANLHVSRSGVITVIALGRANHSGAGGQIVLDETRRDIAPSADARVRGFADTVTGNGYYVGVEIENDGIGEPTSPQQFDAIIRMCAALCRLYGWNPNRIVLHREWSRRKPDHTLRADWRGHTRARLDGVPAPAIVAEPYEPSQAYLRLGSKGATVANLQRKLGVTPDGDFGPKTDAAVKAFQASRGLTADGIVGPKTLAALGEVATPPTPGEAAAAAHNHAVLPPAPQAPAWWKRTLRQGSRGDDVQALQRALGLTADGDFGPKTHAAVQNFQRSAGLAADGIVGPLTARRMGTLPAHRPSPPSPPPPPARPASWYSRLLRIGSRGADVRQVQRIIGAFQDGVFGPNTANALRGWQRSHGLPDDGVVGPATATKMNGR